MTITKSRISSGVAAVAVIVGGLGALPASASTEPPAPPSTEPSTPPVAVEELTRLDADTLVRGAVTDDVTATLNITVEGMDPIAVDIADLSHIAVARITIQPGGQLPWHTHPGPVLVTVTQGELIYVVSDTCEERSYPAGTAFVDAGVIHSVYNPTDGETVIVATYLQMAAEGPLSITEGIAAPDDNCGVPGAETSSPSSDTTETVHTTVPETSVATETSMATETTSPA